MVSGYPSRCEWFFFGRLCFGLLNLNNLLIHYFSFFISTDHQISSSECATGDLYRLHGLCPKAYRSGWCDRSVEGFRTCNGESCSCKCKSYMQFNARAGGGGGLRKCGKLILNVLLGCNVLGRRVKFEDDGQVVVNKKKRAGVVNNVGLGQSCTICKNKRL